MTDNDAMRVALGFVLGVLITLVGVTVYQKATPSAPLTSRTTHPGGWKAWEIKRGEQPFLMRGPFDTWNECEDFAIRSEEAGGRARGASLVCVPTSENPLDEWDPQTHDWKSSRP